MLQQTCYQYSDLIVSEMRSCVCCIAHFIYATLYDMVLCVQITTVDEAKTFYPLFGLGANVALIFSGRAVKYFSQVCETFLSGVLFPYSAVY